MSTARILVVDDNPAMRRAISIILEGEEDLCVCGEAQGIEDGLEQFNSLQPDVVLVDISLRGEDGLDLVRRLETCAPSIPKIVFSLHHEPFYMQQAREAGARGYVVKSEDPRQIVACIRTVLDEGTRWPPEGTR